MDKDALIQRVSLAFLIASCSCICFANDDLFDELDAETTAPSVRRAATQQKDMKQHADDAFAQLGSETRHGTQSQSSAELDAEFQGWKQQYFEELSRYKREILKIWDDAEVTDKTTWVEYSADMKTKKVVDYERNEIRISVIQDDEKATTTIPVEAVVEEIIATDTAKAREKDPVIAAISKKQTEPQAIGNDSQLMLAELIKEPGNKNSERQLASQLSRKAQTDTTQAKTPGYKPITTVTIKLPVDAVLKRAQQYAETVAAQAQRNNIDKSLIYAVMHTESAFNPMARSNIPAFGLMQIVPESAGRDATRLLHGEERILDANYLFNPKNNIEVGAAYINILYYKYLKEISNPLSRLYCAIAAYNTGAGNVSKAFTGKRKISKAVPLINSKTPQQVYEQLRSKLPYDETRIYLKRVVERQQMYAQTQL